MKFNSILNEASQDVVKRLDKLELYFNPDERGGFNEVYPELSKRIDHVRRENYTYKSGGKLYYAVLVILRGNLTQDEEKEMAKTIKDLEIIKDNNAKIQRNNIIIKVLISEQENSKDGV